MGGFCGKALVVARVFFCKVETAVSGMEIN
jgi:hypothetical protein